MDITPFLPNKTTKLPLPDGDALAHCANVVQALCDDIDAHGGLIDFARFMELTLYAPGLGYYAAGARKFGSAGDFVTAPEISSLFSRCLARQCQQVLSQTGGDILEFGAGSGAMAADILVELEQLDCLPERYLIMEVSADLRQRQQEILQARVPHLIERTHWLDHLPPQFTGVVLGNEVLDAMPVQLFRVEQDGVSLAQVGHDTNGFHWAYTPVTDLTQYGLAEITQELAPGYQSEINCHIGPWLVSLANSLQQGVVILLDYGFPRHEYYHPQRGDGTLMCHYRHHAHGDPLILPGLQDITAHVDFTAVAEAAVAAGLDVSGFTNQAYFLLGLGLTDFLNEINPVDTRRQIELAQQVKKLTLPNEMGELFKVIALTKGCDFALRGFSLNDQRVRL